MKIDLDSILNVELTEYGKEVALSYYYLDKGYSVSDSQEILNKKRSNGEAYSFTLLEFIKIFGDGNTTSINSCTKSIDVEENNKKKIRK